MAKYQRPVCILTKKEETDRLGTYLTYQGSARGCDKVGITDFKNIQIKLHSKNNLFYF